MHLIHVYVHTQSYACICLVHALETWPRKFDAALRVTVMPRPRLGSVEFSAQCHAEELLPGDKLAKLDGAIPTWEVWIGCFSPKFLGIYPSILNNGNGVA